MRSETATGVKLTDSLAGKLTANGVVPRRLTPIFRDQHDLSAFFGQNFDSGCAGTAGGMDHEHPDRHAQPMSNQCQLAGLDA